MGPALQATGTRNRLVLYFSQLKDLTELHIQSWKSHLRVVGECGNHVVRVRNGKGGQEGQDGKVPVRVTPEISTPRPSR